MPFRSRRWRWLLPALLAAGMLAGCERANSPSGAGRTTPARGARTAKAFQPSIRFVKQYESAASSAREQGKPLLVFFTADWCRFCHQMAQDAFVQSSVVALSERFVCVTVDADRERELCQELEVSSFPTVLFVSGDGATLARLTGKQPTHRLVMEMQAALQTTALRVDGHSGSLTR